MALKQITAFEAADGSKHLDPKEAAISELRHRALHTGSSDRGVALDETTVRWIIENRDVVQDVFQEIKGLMG